MNKFTIILLTSFLAFIEIGNSFPMHEANHHLVKRTATDRNGGGDDGGGQKIEHGPQCDKANMKNHDIVETFLRELIGHHLGDIELDKMDAKAKQDWYEMLCDTEIIYKN